MLCLARLSHQLHSDLSAEAVSVSLLIVSSLILIAGLPPLRAVFAEARTV